jgi:hypothetical protein
MSIFDTKSDFGVSYGGVPTSGYDWSSIGSGIDYNQPFGIDRTGQFDLPGLEGAGALGSRSGENDFVGLIGKGLEALSKARSYQQMGSTGTSRRSGTYASDGQVSAQGRNWTLYAPRTTQKSSQSGGSSGLGGTIGGIVGTGLGLALAPATGGLSTQLGPVLGRGVGSFFG